MVKYDDNQKFQLLEAKIKELDFEDKEDENTLVKALKDCFKTKEELAESSNNKDFKEYMDGHGVETGLDVLIDMYNQYWRKGMASNNEYFSFSDLHYMLCCLNFFKYNAVPQYYYEEWVDNIYYDLRDLGAEKNIKIEMEKDYIFKDSKGREYYTQVVFKSYKDNELHKTIFFNICWCNEYSVQADPKYNGDYFVNYYDETKDKGIRSIQITDWDFWNVREYPVLVNLLEHSLGISSKSIFARNTEVKILPSNDPEIKEFFNKNNIAGFRPANLAFCLVDKLTSEIYMCYTVGHAHFGSGIYDAEITRGGCKLGYTVVGGASKLWKYIQEYYETHGRDGQEGSCNSIVYYTDNRYYNSQSLGFLENTIFIKTQSGFCNFWLQDPNNPDDERYIMELREREPSKHSYIMDLTRKGYILTCYHPGTSVFVWLRPGYNPTKEEDPKWHNLMRFLKDHKIKLD